MNTKHFAFLIDCPKKGKVMMFPDYLENLSPDSLTDYEEIEADITKLIRWDATLANSNYKVFKTKSKATKK